jgi:NAD(P)-dependent dehydrogenase (short-subunit alcohol dehydrogenase family)
MVLAPIWQHRLGEVSVTLGWRRHPKGATRGSFGRALDEVRAMFETNVFGVIPVTQALLPVLREGTAAGIVNVSSSSGSLTLNPTYPHRAVLGNDERLCNVPVSPATQGSLSKKR